MTLMHSSNLYSLFQQQFAGHENRTFLQLPDGSQLSYGDMDRLSGQFAAALAECNVQPGDRVVAQVDKSPASIALYLSCLRYGAVYVPLNTAYTAAELVFFLTDAKPSLFVCRPADHEILADVAAAAGVPATRTLDTSGDGELNTAAQRCEPLTTISPTGPDALAALVFTSGTTGRSKGAMLSQNNLISNALTLHKLWGWKPGDVLLHALPTFHVHGLFVALHTAMLNASTVLFLPRFEVSAVRKLLPSATIMMGIPTFYTRLLDCEDFGRAECAGMRLFISGSAPLLPSTFENFRERTGHDILERYGMTEAGMITSNPLDGERIAGTVGFALPGVDVRITDNAGQTIVNDDTGAVEIRGPNVSKGYWGMPEKSADEFNDDGFFKTGDMGRLSPDGRLSIVGRSKDLIISGGYNVYPKEIESCLDEIPGVFESAVIGVPHPDFGEGIMAVIVPLAPEALHEHEIIAALENKIARFKHPKRIIFADDLPRNAMGKVQKNILRSTFENTFTG
jgi:malonyl-CoA/methylmalonyl-CoA synthetase